MDKSGPIYKLATAKKVEETKKRSSPTLQILNMPLDKREKRDSQLFNFACIKGQ
jgi:hypothetical protein